MGSETIQCPECDGSGRIDIEHAKSLRGETPLFMSDQEWIDELIYRQTGETIYPWRCPETGNRCMTSDVDQVDEAIARNAKYATFTNLHGPSPSWENCCNTSPAGQVAADGEGTE